MKKSLNIGVFDTNLIHQASPYCGDQVFAKGLEENGYEVVRFDYRAISNANHELIKIATIMKEKPDIVWFGKAERILPSTISILRQVLPDAIFIKWAADVREEPTEHDMGHNQYIDWFFGTFGGEYLKKHLLPSMKGVASIITFTDSDFYRTLNVNKRYNSDVLWTGRIGFGDNSLRNQVIEHLKNIDYCKVKMSGLNDWLGDPEYLYYINGTKIGVGANSFNRQKYSSDRLGNYVACGAFYLPQYFPGIEEVFARYYDIDWYETIEELDEKIKFYLKNEEKRKEIAKNCQIKILSYFDCKPLVENLLHIVRSGKSKYKWDDVYKN